MVTQTFFKEIAPYADNVRIQCDADEAAISVGSTITVSYTYIDPNMIEEKDIDIESGSQVLLMKSSDKTNWSVLSDLSGMEEYKYTLKPEDINIFLQAKVIPKNNHLPEQEIGEPVLSNMIASPFAPTVQNVMISGSGRVGTTLSCVYTFDDLNGNADIDSEVIWYGGNTEIGRGKNYTVKVSDSGQSIYCVVTPKTNAEPRTGSPVSSNRIVCEAVQSISGGGGGKGGFKVSSTDAFGETAASANTVTPPDYYYTYAFYDIQNHWARDAIENLYKKGIVSGKGDGFDPDSALTRAELAVIVSKAIGLQAEFDDCFEDVSKGDWFAQYVQALYNKKIVAGSDGYFAPYEAVTREMAVQIFVTAYKKQLTSDDAALEFPDMDEISTWALPAVKTAVSNGIIAGRDDGRLAPKDRLTRAEAVFIANKLIDNVQ